MTDFLYTDVTAVKLLKNFILAGIGSKINIFQRKTFKLLHKIKALHGQKIYGIVPSKEKFHILLYGGKQFSILTFYDDTKKQWECSESILCDDWLHSAVWLNDNEVAILTAHNVIQIWNTKTTLLQKKHEAKDNSILYSGLLIALSDDILVFSGTVYSEVIIQTVNDGPIHYLKGHKGVIFSITCAPEKDIIVTTSDDRSVRIWSVHNTSHHLCDVSSYWKDVKIDCLCELYGHTARVMRSHITNDCVISVGEDSGICFWSINGKLLKKIISHQNACIWSVDADNYHVVTGGGDCGVALHPLSVKDEYEDVIISLDVDVPKKIKFTSRRNLIFVNESNNLVYYDIISKVSSIHELNQESSYKILDISACKQIIAVSDMCGNLDVFIENCKGDASIKSLISTKLYIGKILSMHWAGNRHLVFCSDNGVITIVAAKDNAIEVLAEYNLPLCKERWLTTVSLCNNNNLLIVGDRNGHIHVYNRGINNPVNTFDRVHGRYGATSIGICKNEIITTGRNGTIKFFSLTKNNELTYKYCKNLEFPWVEKFLDKNLSLICGFQERLFVVYDVNNNMKLLEALCGGGHRSWDAVRLIDKVGDSFEEFVRFVFVKNSVIHLKTFPMSQIVSRNVVRGTHAKEINCLNAIKRTTDGRKTFYVSGGEDTTLIISELDSDGKLQDIFVFKQLSSVRTLKTENLDNNRVLLISAGGRAQICLKILTFDVFRDDIKIYPEELIDYLVKGTDKDRKGSQNWRTVAVDFDPETRIMDLEIIKVIDGFKIFAACSDAYLRMFFLNNEYQFKHVKDIRHHKTCILKTHLIRSNNITFLVTCTTRGDVTFWNVSASEPAPIFSTRTNKSGVNCIASKVINENQFAISTGGDDNTLHVLLLECSGPTSLKVIDRWSSDRFHSSQITGVAYLDDIIVCSSIDQRITLLRWSVIDGKLSCDYISQTFSDVPDLQGIEVLDFNEKSVLVCVFGKGIEALSIPIG